jgi:hypothetical protein
VYSQGNLRGHCIDGRRNCVYRCPRLLQCEFGDTYTDGMRLIRIIAEVIRVGPSVPVPLAIFYRHMCHPDHHYDGRAAARVGSSTERLVRKLTCPSAGDLPSTGSATMEASYGRLL